MKKLLFASALFMAGFFFTSCEQEEVAPAGIDEPIETQDPGGSVDEEAGDRPTKKELEKHKRR